MSFQYLALKKYLPKNIILLILAYNFEEQLCRYNILYLLKQIKINDLDKCLNIAIREENMEIAEYLIKKGAKVPEDSFILDYAVRQNNFDFVKYLVENFGEIVSRTDAADIAAERGYLDILKYLVKNGFKIYDGLYHACVEHHYEIVKFLIDDLGMEPEDSCLTVIVSDGNMEMIKYLIQKGAEIKEETIIKAIEYEELDAVKFMLSKRDFEGERLIKAAVLQSTDEILDFLINYYEEKNFDYYLLEACKDTRIDSIIKYLIKKGAKITKEILELIIKSKYHNNLTKFLIEISPESNIEILHLLCKYNQKQLIKYIVNKGVNIDSESLYLVCENSGDIFLAKYLIKKNPAIINKNVIIAAIKNNFISLAKLLIKTSNIIEQEILYNSCKIRSYILVKYLIKKGVPTNVEILNFVVERKYYEIIKLLVKNKNKN